MEAVSSTVVTIAVAIFGGGFGAIVTAIASRGKARAEANKVLAERDIAKASADFRSAEGFQLLVTEMRKERIELTQIIEKQGGQIEKQSMEIAELKNQVGDLKSTLRDALKAWQRGEPAPETISLGGNR